VAKAVENLFSFIFNQEYFQSTIAQIQYDAKKLPLTKLSNFNPYVIFGTQPPEYGGLIH
jgi:hypothetical protein